MISNRRQFLKSLAAFSCAALALPRKTLNATSSADFFQPQRLLMPDQPIFEYFYRFFTEAQNRCPNPFWEEQLLQAEAIYGTFHGYPPRQVSPEEKEKLAEAIRAFYQEWKKPFPSLSINWEGGAKIRPEIQPVQLTSGLTRHMIVEIHNPLDLPITLQTFSGAMPGPAWHPVTIPAKGWMPVLAPLLLQETGARTIPLKWVSTEKAPQTLQLDAPVTVAAPATLKGAILDGQTGQPCAGRVYVLDEAGFYHFDNALGAVPSQRMKPVVFRPAWQKIPFFYVHHHFTLPVPAGKTRVILERGYEHPLSEVSVTLQPGKTGEVELESSRHIDMKKGGWISGDTHVHWAENGWDVNEDLDLLKVVQEAEDLRVVNNLLLYQWRTEENGGTFIKPDQRPMGPIAELSGENYHVEMAEEYRNDNFWGHINLLNIQEVIQPIATGPGSGGPPDAIDYPLNRQAVEKARSQGGISIEAHNMGPFFCSAVPVNVALGLSDSLDQLDPEYYVKFLNSGFHLPLTNGSDHPARLTGCVRAYVKVEGGFTYANWIEGIRKRRTFTTSGPLLFLTVNDADMGDQLDVKGGTELTVRARVWSRHRVGHFQLIRNGEIIQQKRVEGQEGEIAFTCKADAPQWFAVRCSQTEMFNPLNTPRAAQSTAVYVKVEGAMVQKAEDIGWLLENTKKFRQRVESEANFADAQQKAEALAFVDEGIAVYQKLFDQCKRG